MLLSVVREVRREGSSVGCHDQVWGVMIRCEVS